jgi:hypothetical protein
VRVGRNIRRYRCGVIRSRRRMPEHCDQGNEQEGGDARHQVENGCAGFFTLHEPDRRMFVLPLEPPLKIPFRTLKHVALAGSAVLWIKSLVEYFFCLGKPPVVEGVEIARVWNSTKIEKGRGCDNLGQHDWWLSPVPGIVGAGAGGLAIHASTPA